MGNSRQSRIYHAMIGAAAGDAVGVPYEFQFDDDIPKLAKFGYEVPKGFDRTWPSVPEGTYSDDTAMLLALAKSLVDCNGFNPHDIMKRFVGWYKHGEYTPDGVVFDIGNQTRTALENYIKTQDINTCGSTNPNAKGNGTLMRVLPIALYYNKEADIIKYAWLQSKLTHNHIETNTCCQLYSLTVKYILDGYDASTSIDKSIAYLNKVCRDNKQILDVIGKFKRPFTGYGMGYVVDSLKSSFMIIERAKSYSDAIAQAIKLGQDTDTTACIVGGLAGALFNESGNMENGLKNVDFIKRIAHDLYANNLKMEETKMFRCTNILRDEKGTILVYTLQDENGNVQNLEKGMLKPMMRQGAIQVSNLKLTSDNRIIVTKH